MIKSSPDLKDLLNKLDNRSLILLIAGCAKHSEIKMKLRKTQNNKNLGEYLACQQTLALEI